MTMNFHDRQNRSMYTGRSADSSWAQLIAEEVQIAGRKAADIGCGGGIYSKALVGLGAASVVGVDFSLAMLEGAAVFCAELPEIRFQQGNALATGLEHEAVEVVLERALIHHLTADELTKCFQEAYRILKPQGTFIVQDRTPEDCLLEGSRDHLRGYLLERFPQLKAKETGRRHGSVQVQQRLKQAGFDEIKSFSLWELRQSYESFASYREDIHQRTGRSILHELTEQELQSLTEYIQKQTGIPDDEPVQEQDRWTVWLAKKH